MDLIWKYCIVLEVSFNQERNNQLWPSMKKFSFFRLLCKEKYITQTKQLNRLSCTLQILYNIVFQCLLILSRRWMEQNLTIFLIGSKSNFSIDIAWLCAGKSSSFSTIFPYFWDFARKVYISTINFGKLSRVIYCKYLFLKVIFKRLRF